MYQIVINAANLHVGGGVQVAASFIEEMINPDFNLGDNNYLILCSTEVISYLTSENHREQISIVEANIYGFKKPSENIYELVKDAIVIFTIFGPLYYKLSKKSYNICGFAQAWIAYPHNIAYQQLPILDFIKNKIKFTLQWYFFKKNDRLIVEKDHVKNALVNNLFYDESRVEVAQNCVSSKYLTQSYTPRVKDKSKVIFGVMGRAYSHKNLTVLLKVNEILQRKYTLDCEFHFTLTDKEFCDLNFINVENFKTVGILDLNGCLEFYSKIDALIFTSLLECFSATPIEAMARKVPVFASDLEFVRDCCQENVFYVDPMNPEHIAHEIIKGLADKELLAEKVYNAYYYVKNLPTAQDRARLYLKYITQ